MRSSSLARFAAACFVTAAALSMAAVQPAEAAEVNPECSWCHAPMNDWDVQAVDRDTACQKCHTPGLLGTHPVHYPGANCGAVCHPGWGNSIRFATPTWRGPQGSFASAESPNVSSAILHIIHSNPRWPAGISKANSECASCHAIAACTACHEDAPATSHASHSATGNEDYEARSPWYGVMGSGIVGEDQKTRTAAYQANMCASSECHDISVVQDRTPVGKEEGSPEVARVGTWSTRYGSNFSGGATIISNKAGASVSLTFTGQMVELLADKDPYRGAAEIWLDGELVETVDAYATTSSFQQVLYRSDALPLDQHTITVKVKGTKGTPAAKAAFFSVDALRTYAEIPNSLEPRCVSCHADKGEGHGTDFAHEATAQAGELAGHACSACHSMLMVDEHARDNAASSAYEKGVCSACHPDPAGFVLDTYDYTCGWSTCHTGTQSPHAALGSVHIVEPDAQTADCISCHGNDLSVIHDDDNASRAQHFSLVGPGSSGMNFDTSCLTCHSTTLYPSTTSCVSPACHVGSGVVSMPTHPALDHDADPAWNEAPYTSNSVGPKPCTTCHAVNAVTGKPELVSEHGKPSAQTSTGQLIGCTTCHEASYLPTDWMNENNTCVACHTVDKAGAPHTTYAASHDFSAVGDNYNSCGAGAGVFCHNTSAVDVLHDPANTTNADCESCHTSAIRQTGVPVVRDCQVCHAESHDMGVHTVTTSGDCAACHGTTDVIALHDACDTCHANVNYPGITKSVVSADCVNCHKAGGVYDSTYRPHDPQHATGYEASHLATLSQSQNYAGFGPCSQCHDLTMKGAHEGPTDIQFDLAGYGDQCIACHKLKVDDLDGPWNKSCQACHATIHADPWGAHNAASTVLTGGEGETIEQACGGTDCHGTYVHAVWFIPKHTCTTCHPNPQTKPTLNCGDAGCHDDLGAHGSHELDVVNSNYNDATEAGCTNSGAGCHGVDTEADYGTPYHPDTGCATGACHASATYPSTNFATPPVCQDCHNGTYVNAPDVSVLAQSGAGGHYNETTHSATPAGTVSAGGTYTAACSDCHNPVNATGIDGLYNQHQGLDSVGDVTCSGCHNKNAAIQALITGSTRVDTCNACHTAAVLPAMVQHGPTAPAVAGQPVGGCSAGISGCHENIDIHFLHRNDATGNPNGCLMSGCHDATKQAFRPTLTSCGATGACHTGEAHPNAAAAHDASTQDNGGCIDCHEQPDIRDQHSDNCSLCHNSGTNVGDPAGPNTADCITCHGDEVGTHSYTGRTSASEHYSTNLETHTGEFVGKESPLTGTVVAPGGWGANNYSIACSSCHLTDLMDEHALSSATFGSVPGTNPDKCVACHKQAVDNFAADWSWNKRCDECHTGSASLAPVRHTEMGSKHDATGLGTPSTYVTSTRFTDDFTSTSFGWTNISGTWSRRTSEGSDNSPCMRSASSTTVQRVRNSTAINTSGYTSAKLSFWYKESLSNSSEYLTVSYGTASGGPWTELWRVTGDVGSVNGETITLDLPAAAISSSLFIRFESNATSTGRYSWVDDVLVEATSETPGTGIAGSCGSPASDCHDLSDVSKIHTRDLNGDGDRSDPGEAKCGACHKGNAASDRPTTLDCTASGCHGPGTEWYSNANEANHRLYHDVRTAAIPDGNASGRPAPEVDPQCAGCHEPMLDSDHYTLDLASGAFNGGATRSKRCGACHYKTTNSVKGVGGAVTNVPALSTRVAISNDRHNCTVCHTSTQWTSTHVRMHESRGPNEPTVGSTEFNNTYSGHRSFDFMVGQSRTIGGSGSSFPAYPTQMFKSGVTLRGQTLGTTTMVICSDCHTYEGATGPHGAAMTISLGDGSGQWSGPWSGGTSGAILANSGDGIGPTSGSRPICAKCHSIYNGNWGNNSHSEHVGRGTQGAYCTQCHLRVPHAWKRPRLLARYQTDPEAYLDPAWTDSGLRSFARKNYSTNWNKADCYAGCSTSRHPVQSTPWP